MEQIVEGSTVSSSSSPPIPTTTVATATSTPTTASTPATTTTAAAAVAAAVAANNFLASLAPAPSPLSNLFANSNSNAMDIDIAASIFPATPSSPLSFSPSFQMSLENVVPPPKVTPALTPKESPRKEDGAAATAIAGPPTSMIVPAKRGYKSHVPSACINCKKAHLACDVSRPCKRCVALGKTDTCQDIKHKKRGRPRLRDKQASGDGQGNDSGYEVMYGTIQTPSFTAQPQQPPQRQEQQQQQQQQQQPIPSSSSTVSTHQQPASQQPRPVAPLRSAQDVQQQQQQQQTTTISFIHEPIESFQQQSHHPPLLQQHHHQQTPSPTHQPPPQPPHSDGSFLQQPVQLMPHIPFDELLHDSNNMMQQYMVPPYMTMPMQHQSFSQPEQQQHAPETMSLQMKMGNAFAQRPTSLPLAPPPPHPHPQSPHQHQQMQHPQVKHRQQQQQHNQQHNQFQHQQQTSKQNGAGQVEFIERQTEQQRKEEGDVVKPKESHPVPDRRFSNSTKHNNNSSSSSSSKDGGDNSAVTVILSMEVCCARVSEEVTGMWGYYPQEFAHRSLYDFISAKDTDRLARLHRLLLDNIVDVAKSTEPPPQTERTTSELFHKMGQDQLTTVASGSSMFSDTLHVKKRSGEEELYEMFVCMGGGLGADLRQPASHSKLYIIAQFRKHRYEVSTLNPFDTNNAAMASSSSSLSSSRLVSSSFSQTSSSPSTKNNNSDNGNRSSRSDAKSSINNNNKLSLSNNSGLKKGNSFLKSNPPFRHTMARTITDIGRVGPSMDMRSRSALPAHYATSSQLSTISKIEPAKINVAPITHRSSPSFASSSLASSWQTRLGRSSFTASNNIYDNINNSTNSNSNNNSNNSNTINNHRHHHNSSPDNSDTTSSSSSSSASTYTPSSSAAATVSKTTFVSAPLSSARESNSRYSTLAYRFAPMPPTKLTTGSPRGGPNVTHPTTQYFLQTSSSTLNAAASAAQYSSRNTYQTASSMADNDRASGKTDSNRKVEMSIRSLLC